MFLKVPISKRVSMGAKWNGLGSVRNYVDTYSRSLFFVRFHSFHTILENKNCRLHQDSNSNCPPRSQVHDPGQCDQIFWKFWPKKFLTKVAQTFGNCLAFFENITFYVKTDVATLRDFFYSNIWPHWMALGCNIFLKNLRWHFAYISEREDALPNSYGAVNNGANVDDDSEN